MSISKPITYEIHPGELVPVDGFIEVRHGLKNYLILLEVKSNAQLRDARRAIEHLERMSRGFPSTNTYPVFISQYLNPSIRDFCASKNMGYFDFSGNYRLAFDDVFIEREVPSENSEKKRLKSLFSLKSSRVIRRLLHEPQHLWKVQQLALDAFVSPATVSMVKDKLLGEEYAARQGEAFILTNPEKLLVDWAQHYNSRLHKQIECYGHGDLDELEFRFAKYCRDHSVDYAFTMFSGARRVAQFTRGVQRAYAYVPSVDDPLELAERLELKQVESGGNFRLILPADDDVFYGKQQVLDEVVVSDIQLYLDLAGHRGRGEENAEYLLEHRIRPTW